MLLNLKVTGSGQLPGASEHPMPIPYEVLHISLGAPVSLITLSALPFLLFPHGALHWALLSVTSLVHPPMLLLTCYLAIKLGSVYMDVLECPGFFVDMHLCVPSPP